MLNSFSLVSLLSGVRYIRKCGFLGQPCHHNGQFCWLDPVDKKYYRVNTIHLKRLVKYVENGSVLDIHDDVPHDIREQICNKE